MLNLINNYFRYAVNQYGAAPVVAGALVVGLILYPLVKKVAELAFRLICFIHNSLMDLAITIRLRSLGCEECAQHHKSHITAIARDRLTT